MVIPMRDPTSTDAILFYFSYMAKFPYKVHICSMEVHKALGVFQDPKETLTVSFL